MPSPFHCVGANARWRWMPRPLSPRLPWEEPEGPLAPPRVFEAMLAGALGLDARPPALPPPSPDDAADVAAPIVVDIRRGAERQWIVIARAFGRHCWLGAQILDAEAAPDREETLSQLVADTFAAKATNTLLRRACAMRMLVAWRRCARRHHQALSENEF